MTKSDRPSPPGGKGAPTNPRRFSGFCRSKAVGRPTQAEAEALGDHILDAGWELLLDQGFERFSFDRLARFARIGKPTIYARFANKEEFLRALLARQISERHREIFALAAGQDIAHTLPMLTRNAIERFLSPEGRLIDRLIDWLDYEADLEQPSLRGWAVENTRALIEELLSEANDNGDIRIRDVSSAALFLIEGVVGHAKLVDTRAPVDRQSHLDWAERYCAMILKTFAAPA